MESIETRVKELETWARRLDTVLHGNGKPGLCSDFDSLCRKFEVYIATQETRDEDAEKARRAQRFRLNLLLTAIGLVVVPMLIAIIIKR